MMPLADLVALSGSNSNHSSRKSAAAHRHELVQRVELLGAERRGSVRRA